MWGHATWTGADTPWRYPGQYHDPETGLHYNHHRYYHPGSGRYLSPDPLGLAPAPNPYGYPANPTTFIDPHGLNPCPVITDRGLRHSFGRHAHEWFGMSRETVSFASHSDAWRAMIEKAMGSSKIVEWQTRNTPTFAHFVRNMEDGKPFLVQFDRVTGELVTAFKPDQRQLARIYRLLSKS